MKNSKVIILVVIILLVIGFAVYNFHFSQAKTLTVGNCSFDMPEGYFENGTNAFCATTITNGDNNIFIEEHNGNDINKFIKEYEDYLKELNDSTKIQKLNIDGMDIYKTVNKNNPNTVHYWFVKGNNAYNIYKWDHNDKMDNIVMNLINSAH